MGMRISKKNGYLEVELQSGDITKIDVDDRWILKQFPHWRIHKSEGHVTSVAITRYLKTEYGTVREDRYLHRIIMNKMGVRKLSQVDHKDRNPLNNTKDNLRWVTASQNSRNSVKRSRHFSSFYRGVHRNKSAKVESWVAQIKTHGKAKHLGSFRTEREAAMAYNEKSKELFGEYGWQNIIE